MISGSWNTRFSAQRRPLGPRWDGLILLADDIHGRVRGIGEVRA